MKITKEDMAAFLRAVGDDTPNDHGLPERANRPVARQLHGPVQMESPVNTEDTAPVAHLHQLQGGWVGEPPALAYEAHILEVLTDNLKQVGLVDDRLALGRFVYLVSKTRHLSRVVSLAVKGPSSAGKSWPVEEALKFETADAYIEMTAASERAVVYDDRPCRHKHLVIAEAAGISGETGKLLIRSLLSEGRIKYDVTVNLPNGKFGVQHIDRPGPTGLITTTTAINLHPENETRFFSFTVSDTSKTTRDVITAWAKAAAGLGPERVDYSRWHDLGRWLSMGEHRVVIPYAPRIVKAIPDSATKALRLKRDWINIQQLIKAHALLHRATRERDGEGRIVATIADYEVVREMVEPLVAEAAESSVSSSVREAVEAVRELSADHQDGVPLRAVAAHLGLSESAASRRVKMAKKMGYLRNENEGKVGQPAQLVATDEIPADSPVLPTPLAIGANVQVALETPVDTGDTVANDPCN